MIRLLGILLGAAIAVAFLILLVGVPQITNDDPAEPVAVNLPLQAQPLTTPEPDPAPPAATIVPAAPAPQAPAPVAEELQPAAESVPAPAPIAEPASIPASAADELHWYAFWSPFRSQIAANGFIAQLQRVTGLDYRVVSVKPGVYEVAFAYSDDAEIETNLAQISTATGLDVPES